MVYKQPDCIDLKSLLSQITYHKVNHKLEYTKFILLALESLPAALYIVNLGVLLWSMQLTTT